MPDKDAPTLADIVEAAVADIDRVVDSLQALKAALLAAGALAEGETDTTEEGE